MLTKISIESFKSLYKIDRLELGRVNVFIGANGCGKTNFLEAVGMLSAAASGEVGSESLGRRGVRLSPYELYKTNLSKMSASHKITFSVDGEWNHSSLSYTVSLSPPLNEGENWVYEEENLFYDGKVIIRDGQIQQGGTKWEQDSEFKISEMGGIARFIRTYGKLGDAPGQMNDYLREYAIFSPTTPVLRGLQPDMNPQHPVGLLGGRLAEAVGDILTGETLGNLNLDEVLELLDWVDGFQITAPSQELLSPDIPSLRSVVEFSDIWMGPKRNRISGYDASEGSLYVLFMLVLALHPKSPRFFSMDNFGQTLNPRLERAYQDSFVS